MLPTYFIATKLNCYLSPHQALSVSLDNLLISPSITAQNLGLAMNMFLSSHFTNLTMLMVVFPLQYQKDMTIYVHTQVLRWNLGDMLDKQVWSMEAPAHNLQLLKRSAAQVGVCQVAQHTFTVLVESMIQQVRTVFVAHVEATHCW